MKKYRNSFFTIILCTTFFSLFLAGSNIKLTSVEDLEIYIGAGIGINKNGGESITYRVSTVANSYKEEGGIESVLNTGLGSTIGKTRESRQKEIGKQFFLGLLKVYLVDEECAQYGVRSLIDIIFKNPVVNDTAFLAVCKGKNEQYFTYSGPGYDNPPEYISNMLKNSSEYNFFRSEYTIKDGILSIDAEGKNMVCPYLEMKEDGINISGMAVFKKDKLGAILDMKDTRVMNMLRENKVQGILTIQRDSGEYINYGATSKRKIKCSKKGENYIFSIDLDLNGEIINNELYKDMAGNIDEMKKFEKDMGNKVEKMCGEFLDRMKNEYKVDCLQLGWVAAAKYGRDTGVDWNQVVCNSDINVKVKVHVDKVGRGEY